MQRILTAGCGVISSDRRVVCFNHFMCDSPVLLRSQASSPDDDTAPPCPICECRWPSCFEMMWFRKCLASMQQSSCLDETGTSSQLTWIHAGASGECWVHFVHVGLAGLNDIENERERAVVLDCLHCFCVPCISRWAKLRRECPLCKVRRPPPTPYHEFPSVSHLVSDA